MPDAKPETWITHSSNQCSNPKVNCLLTRIKDIHFTLSDPVDIMVNDTSSGQIIVTKHHCYWFNEVKSALKIGPNFPQLSAFKEKKSAWGWTCLSSLQPAPVFETVCLYNRHAF